MPELTIAQRLGSVPIDMPRKPAVNIKTADTLAISRAVLQNLPAHILFRRGDDFITVERADTRDDNGFYPVTQRLMTPRRFRSWLLNYMLFQEGTGDDAKAVKLPKDLAETILASDVFFNGVAELEEIAQIRMPIWSTDAEGKKTITLAPAGFNPKNGTYTVETLDYTTNIRRYPIPRLQRCWTGLMHSFPWRAESEAEETQTWELNKKTYTGAHPVTNRSASCCLAIMLSQYCRYLFTRAPMAIFNANQQGSGKSLLAWFCVAPTWGMAAGSPTPRNDEEMIKALQTYAKAHSPYIMLDDIPTLASPTINMFATSPLIKGRNMGSDTVFSVRNNCQILATGNGLNTTPDIERRSLIIDLFLETDALERPIPNVLTKESLNTPGFRSDMLGLLWSMVANWAEAGCPKLVDGSAKPTFEDFAAVVGSIMVHNGFLNPFTPRVTDGEGGDLIGRAVDMLLSHIAAYEMKEEGLEVTTKRFSVSEIIRISDELGYTDTITRGAADRNKSMGNRLSKMRKRKLVDDRGRAFRFGHGESAVSSYYTFTIIDWGKETAAADAEETQTHTQQ